MTQNNVEQTRTIYADFARGDIDAVLAAYHDDVEWGGAGDLVDIGGSHRGTQAVLANVLSQIPERYDEFRIDTDQFLDVGDRVVVLGQWHIRAKGAESSFHGPHAAVYSFEGGRVTSVQFFADTAAWLRAAAPSPQPKASVGA